ncbi:MAG TPA: hypothetical protein VEO54_00380 [Thermoanaerobaculia bacterium]|nr:hypothetical protein [Thermoanaerobaculia bacterium]
MVARLLLVLLAALPLAAEAPFLNINPSWSPDGRRLVFQSDRNGVNTQLYLIGADGTNERRLTTHGASDTHPVWSPDGQWILFDSDRDGTWNLYVIRPDGTGERRLTRRGASNAAAFARHPAWCAGGTKIVFDSDRDGNEEIYIMNADGTEQRRLTNNEGRDSHASCAPDGKVLWGSRTGGMQSMDLDGTNVRQIAARGGAPKVSADGRRIAYSASQEGGKPDLWVMHRDGSSPRNLTGDAFTSYEHAWSPDGARLAYYSDDSGRFELYVMNADGTGRRRLTDGGYQNAAPRWSPDGRSIVFASDRDGDWEIYRMSADGSAPARLTWSPGRDANPAFTADGARITFESSRDYASAEESDPYVMRADGQEPVRMVPAPSSEGKETAYSPDRKSMAFVSPSGDLHRRDVASRAVTQLTTGIAVRSQPHWSPDGQRILFSGAEAAHEEIYAIDSAGGTPQRLTRGALGYR